MGFWQNAVETYDAHAELAGAVREGHQPLAPISHTVTGASIEITLDQNGKLIDAVPVGKTDTKTVIPVTENSAGRTSAPAAHPLCEQIGYLSGKDEEKYTLYVEQLQAWADSEFTHPMLLPILTYVRGKTLLADLAAHGIDSPGDKDLVRWRVLGIGSCFTDKTLFRAYDNRYQSMRKKSGDADVLCMISGETVLAAEQHPKGIIPLNGNAKLISSNDTANFTYRGRFTDDKQAATIGYTASQKAHNAIRWLAAEQGEMFGGRTFLCWNPQGKQVPRPTLPFPTAQTAEVTPSDYREALQRTLAGWRTQLPDSSGVVIAAFDAATSGREALTYYSELRASDFLQRLYDWDETCCWWGWNSECQRYAIQSPPLRHIVNCAFGVQQKEKGKDKARLNTDDRIMRQQLQRLLSCRIDRARMPADIEQALVRRASMPLAYERNLYEGLLFTACAVIRKYHYDLNREELKMTLEPERADRSYQFGRLLAVFEKAERDTFDSEEKREPSAVRLQAAYCQHPLHTAKIIESQLERAYFPRLELKSRIFYKNLIGEIMAQICKCPENEFNLSLGDTYLIGYYLQRNELYKSKTQKEEKEN